MPWRVTDVMEQRIEFVGRVCAGGESFSAVCRALGVSRPTGYRWWRRYREGQSVSVLSDRSRRPHRSPRRTRARWEERVVALRRRYGWGARKLQVLLARKGIDLTVITINRILRRYDLVRPEDAVRPALRRFERAAPNELWQMDFKGEMAYPGGWCFPLSVLDDHSRYVVGLDALSGTAALPVQQSLIAVFEQYGVPEAMLMDHGTPWWSASNGHGLTWLSVWLMQQGIRLHYSGVGHPQTQGKVERFHRTLKHALGRDGRPSTGPAWQGWLTDFRVEYNEVRPHEALGLQPPSSRYRPSPRAYNPHPPDWVYPEGAIVRRLNTQGCLNWNRRRLFVCEALAGQHVQLTTLDHLLLVSYHDLYIREIDLDSGRSKSILKAADGN